MRIHPLLCAAILTFAQGTAVIAQSSDYVRADDRLYRQLDRSEAMVGMPHVQGRLEFSRIELARRYLAVSAEATRKREAGWTADPALQILLDGISAELAAEIVAQGGGPVPGSRLVDRVSVHGLATNSPSHGYTQALGLTDAQVNPILRDDRGPRTSMPVGVGSYHVLQPHRNVVVVAQPEMRLRTGEDSAGLSGGLHIRQAYARALFAGWSVDAGRVEHSWSASRVNDLLLSSNAPGAWGARLGRDKPLVLPYVSSVTGPIDAELFWFDLGKRQNFPGANMMGWRLNIQPFRNLQIGGALMSHYGGEGAPAHNNTTDIIEDLFLFWLVQSGTTQFSNKMLGVNGELDIPSAAGMSLYSQLVVDDFDSNPKRFRRWLRESVGHVYGVELNRLTSAADLRWFAEYQHTGYTMYRHGITQFSSGWTYDQSLIGSALGPDGDAVYTGITKDLSSDARIAVNAAWEDRSNDFYFTTTGDEPGDDGYSKLVDKPNEKRARLTGELQSEWSARSMDWMLRAGVERVSNFAFVQDASRTNYLLELRVEKRLR